jgi:hypothetical protein
MSEREAELAMLLTECLKFLPYPRCGSEEQTSGTLLRERVSAALGGGVVSRTARILQAVDEFRAAAIAEEAAPGGVDDEAHRRAWDRYMAAKRGLVEAGESSSETP